MFSVLMQRQDQPEDCFFDVLSETCFLFDV